MTSPLCRRCSSLLVILVLLLSGCGFHLRGVFSIPESLQRLQILPIHSFNALQRPLKQRLKSNAVTLISAGDHASLKPATLTLLNEAFSERTIAYGSDAQPNRAILQLTIRYQLTDPTGKVLVDNGTVLVERELSLTPNATLGTDNERKRLQSDLYGEAASQLILQIIAPSHANPR